MLDIGATGMLEWISAPAIIKMIATGPKAKKKKREGDEKVPCGSPFYLPATGYPSTIEWRGFLDLRLRAHLSANPSIITCSPALKPDVTSHFLDRTSSVKGGGSSGTLAVRSYN